MMKNGWIALFLTVALMAGPAVSTSAQTDADGELWQRVDLMTSKAALGEPDIAVRQGEYSVFQLDELRLGSALDFAPLEFTTFQQGEHRILLPMPDGSLQAFKIWESPVMEPALAAEFPMI